MFFLILRALRAFFVNLAVKLVVTNKKALVMLRKSIAILVLSSILLTACKGDATSATTLTPPPTRSAQVSELENSVAARDSHTAEWQAAREGPEIPGHRHSNGDAE